MTSSIDWRRSLRDRPTPPIRQSARQSEIESRWERQALGAKRSRIRRSHSAEAAVRAPQPQLLIDGDGPIGGLTVEELAELRAIIANSPLGSLTAEELAELRAIKANPSLTAEEWAELRAMQAAAATDAAASIPEPSPALIEAPPSRGTQGAARAHPEALPERSPVVLDTPPRPTPNPVHSEAVHPEAVHSEVVHPVASTAAVVAATVVPCDGARPARPDVDDEPNGGAVLGSVSTAWALDGAELGASSSVVGDAVLGTSDHSALGVAEPLMRVGVAANEYRPACNEGGHQHAMRVGVPPAHDASFPSKLASSPSKLALHRCRRYTWDEDDEGPEPTTRRAEQDARRSDQNERRAEQDARRTEQDARRAEQASELDELSFGTYPNTWETAFGTSPKTWETGSAHAEKAAARQPPQRSMELRETLFFCGPQSRPQSRAHHDASESELELPLPSPSYTPNTAPLHPAVPSPSYPLPSYPLPSYPLPSYPFPSPLPSPLPYPSYPSASSPSPPSPSLCTPSSCFCFACGAKLVRPSVP